LESLDICHRTGIEVPSNWRYFFYPQIDTALAPDWTVRKRVVAGRPRRVSFCNDFSIVSRIDCPNIGFSLDSCGCLRRECRALMGGGANI
jgi:hypothetical protein